MFKPSVSGLGEVGAVLESGPHSLSLGEICNSLEFQRRFRYSLLSGWGARCGGNVGRHFPVCCHDQGLCYVTTLPSAE